MAHPDIIIIVVDTLRKDAIRFQQAENDNTNYFRDFTIYSNCIATSPWTVPSHVSLFTGKYPLEHRIHETKTFKLPEQFAINDTKSPLKEETIFQKLRKDGYSNYGISTNVNLRPGTIFERGFDLFQYFEFPFSQIDYDNFLTKISDELGAFSSGKIIVELAKHRRFKEILEIYKRRRNVNRTSDVLGYPKEKGATHILRQLENSSIIKPFTLFLNIMEMHEPYSTTFDIYDLYKELVTNDRMKTSDISNIRKDYYIQGDRVRDFLVNLFKAFKKMGVWDDSVIIITSDHGQSLWENGFGGHGTFLFDELVNIPLLVKYPKQDKTRIIDKLCSLADIYGLIRNIEIDPKSELQSEDIVFSESFGTLHDVRWFIRGVKNHNLTELQTAYETLNFRRIAAFKGAYKICINAENGTILEFKINSKNELPEREVILNSGILDDIEIFDRNITLPFR